MGLLPEEIRGLANKLIGVKRVEVKVEAAEGQANFYSGMINETAGEKEAGPKEMVPRRILKINRNMKTKKAAEGGPNNN